MSRRTALATAAALTVLLTATACSDESDDPCDYDAAGRPTISVDAFAVAGTAEDGTAADDAAAGGALGGDLSAQLLAKTGRSAKKSKSSRTVHHYHSSTTSGSTSGSSGYGCGSSPSPSPSGSWSFPSASPGAVAGGVLPSPRSPLPTAKTPLPTKR
ncbi:hypothetical protein [Kitasatospora sp. DSM 101779]|uniref:hypothetical protein n=1 Tax=Kitasatospora sp. DSM 101779 TaxID=2853165 RepID=UPI0021DAC7F1|nr:hypothetical protein [Kitasatospora sp. DSM 101779]MCU7823925.1 hypothetical protein [Kitasatospora sp. DSM 101779]